MIGFSFLSLMVLGEEGRVKQRTYEEQNSLCFEDERA